MLSTYQSALRGSCAGDSRRALIPAALGVKQQDIFRSKKLPKYWWHRLRFWLPGLLVDPAKIVNKQLLCTFQINSISRIANKDLTSQLQEWQEYKLASQNLLQELVQAKKNHRTIKQVAKRKTEQKNRLAALEMVMKNQMGGGGGGVIRDGGLEHAALVTLSPTPFPTTTPTATPTHSYTWAPTKFPSPVPTLSPSPVPTVSPSPSPTSTPTLYPTASPNSPA